MQNKTAVPVAGMWGFLRAIKRSIVVATVLLTFDGAIEGVCAWAWLVCPVWLSLSLLGNAVERPGWRLALVRIGFPIVTFGLLWANNIVQDRIAEANARRVIQACEAYQVAHGTFPGKLEELVPQFLNYVPTAKHCLTGQFSYHNFGTPLLVWRKFLLYRRIYNFETRTWGHLD